MKKLTFILLCLEGAVLSFNIAAAAVLIPSMAADFAIPRLWMGRIIWLYMLPYGVAALLWGPLARLVDARKIKLACLFCFSLANLAACLTHSITLFLAARFFMGVFGASVIPLTLILVSYHIGESSRATYLGAFFSTTFVASLLGLAFSGFIHWRLIFLIPAILGFALTIIMYVYLSSFAPERRSFSMRYAQSFRDKRVLQLISYIFLVSLFYHGVQQWLAVYFSKALLLDQFTISMLVTLTSLSGVFGEVIGGVMADFLGRRKVINAGLLLMTASTFLLILKLPVYFLAFLMVVWGVGWTFNHVGMSAALTFLPRKLLHETASLNSSVRFVSGGIGVFLSGMLMHKSFTLAFFVLGMCLLALVFIAKPLSGAFDLKLEEYK